MTRKTEEPASDSEASSPVAQTASTTRKTTVSIAQLRPAGLWPLANPRRIRLTAPGNPVHR